LSRRILAAIAATTWLAGCVSILGVDAEDHDDVGSIICACSDAGAELCEAFVTAALERSPEVEERVLDCAASDAGCAELDACLRETGVCSGPRERCSPVVADDRVNVRCCEGLSCEGGKCVEGAACLLAAAACDGTGCCEGLTCAEGACCVPDGVPCQRNEQCCGTSTCLDGVCQVCGAINDSCQGGLADGTCCDGAACVQGFCRGV